MSSKENLCSAEITPEQQQIELNQKKKNDELGKESSQPSTSDVTKATENDNVLPKTDATETPTEPTTSYQTAPSSNTIITMKSDINDFIEMRKPDDYDVKCRASFRLEFTEVTGISAISSTKAWIQSPKNLKLVDIVKGQVLQSYISNVQFWNINGIDEYTVLFSLDNSVMKFRINDDKTTNLEILLNISEDEKQSARNTLNVIGVLSSGELITCVTRKLGCACFAKDVAFIERYDNQGKLLKQSKIHDKGKPIIRDAYSITENNNGDICIAGEKVQKRGEFWVIVLNSDFRLKFTYDRNTATQMHIPSSLAADSENNFVVVNKFRDRTKHRKTSLTNQKKKELTYVALIDENGIFRLHIPTEGFNSEGPVTFIDIDKEDQVWMVMDSGQIIVWAFKKLPQNDQDAVVSDVQEQ